MTQAGEPTTNHQESEDEAPRFEGLVERIEEIVEALEAGSLPLEESLRLFEEGMGLVRQADEILRKAEAKVDILLQRGDETLVETFEVPEEEE